MIDNKQSSRSPCQRHWKYVCVFFYIYQRAILGLKPFFFSFLLTEWLTRKLMHSSIISKESRLLIKLLKTFGVRKIGWAMILKIRRKDYISDNMVLSSQRRLRFLGYTHRSMDGWAYGLHCADATSRFCPQWLPCGQGVEEEWL